MFNIKTTLAGILAALSLAGGTGAVLSTSAAYACSGGNCGALTHSGGALAMNPQPIPPGRT
jgi:hypothetical protein